MLVCTSRPPYFLAWMNWCCFTNNCHQMQQETWSPILIFLLTLVWSAAKPVGRKIVKNFTSNTWNEFLSMLPLYTALLFHIHTSSTSVISLPEWDQCTLFCGTCLFTANNMKQNMVWGGRTHMHTQKRVSEKSIYLSFNDTSFGGF